MIDLATVSCTQTAKVDFRLSEVLEVLSPCCGSDGQVPSASETGHSQLASHPTHQLGQAIASCLLQVRGTSFAMSKFSTSLIFIVYCYIVYYIELLNYVPHILLYLYIDRYGSRSKGPCKGF